MNNLKLYNEDCLKILPNIKDKSVDAIICDLPYGITQNKSDIIIPLNLLWKQYKRIIKDNGVIALFAQGIFYVDLINSNRKMFRYDLIWNKILTSGFLNAKRMPLRQHEQIAIFYKKQPTYNPQFTIGEPLHSKGINYMNKEHKNQNYGKHKIMKDTRKGETKKYPKSILNFQKPHPSKAQHRTQKSVKLTEWLIKTYTNENELILDNAMGIGTTGIACKNTNRKFIGIEIDRGYFEIAQKNIL